MNTGCKLKVCGIRRPVDFRAASNIGAGAVGFIFYPQSPRAITVEKYLTTMQTLSYAGLRVAVDVEPDEEQLEALKELGFDRFQLHFDINEGYLDRIISWSKLVGKEKLWLVPRLKCQEQFPRLILPYCSGIVCDTFSPDMHGGTGKKGDWNRFRELREKYREVEWILAGGLTPENLGEATRSTNPDWVDINSGVEVTPGVKDVDKLEKLRLWVVK